MPNLIDEAFGIWLAVGQSSVARPVPPTATASRTPGQPAS